MTHTEWVAEMKAINKQIEELSTSKTALSTLHNRRQELLNYLVDNHINLLK